MMSNPSSVLQHRQRLHRRQNSTPTAFEALKLPSLSPAIQRHSSHRRGQSLDQRRPIPGQHRQAGNTLITNPGSATTGHQILREAQQQKTARPGQQNQSPVSPQCGTFGGDQTIDNSTMHAASAIDAFIQQQAKLQVASPLQQYFSQDTNMPTTAGLEGMDANVDENDQHYFQSSHSPKQGLEAEMIDERRMSQPEMQVYAAQRPTTPAQQRSSGKLFIYRVEATADPGKAQFPLTPATTPFKQGIGQHHFPRTAHSSPLKRRRQDTIKAPHSISMQRGRSLEGTFEYHDQATDVSSPARIAPLILSSSFEIAEMPMPRSMSLKSVPMKFEYSIGSHESFQTSPESALSMSEHSFPASPEDARTPLFGEICSGNSVVAANTMILPSFQPETGCSSPTKAEHSPRRLSISDLKLEPGVSASIEETNITLDDIAQFIEGPDPIDNKWVCKYDNCNKKFGRKENIKSHVQTHLGDRQFRCDHCSKCFVRGHDLKRHAKIHTGSKPYPCLCGNAFARHDALTRHRQRGNCIGAFEGVVKKMVKKGRPRKHRPEMDNRLEKASRTRKRVEEREHQYSSSSAESSVSSFGSPPTDTLENLSIRGISPFDDMSLFGVVSQPPPVVTGFPPDLFTFTPPASPGYSTGNKPSPYHRALTPTDMSHVPEISNLQTQLLGAMNQEPADQGLPSLCHSSGSPLPDVSSFDFSSEETMASSHQSLDFKETSNHSDFDSFLHYGNIGLDSGQDSFFDL